MKTHSNTSKYKLLVLLDKSKDSFKTLKDAVNLAKLIEGSIDIFQVEPPTSVVRYENQIATMRTIDEERYKQEMALKGIVSIIREEENLPIISNFTFGNVKNEIKNHIEKTNPDIVVLGKRKKKMGGLLGDKITKYILNDYNGSVLISSKNEGSTFFESQSIGFLDATEGVEKIALVNDLKQHNKKPLKVFKRLTDVDVANKKTVTLETQKKGHKKNAIVYEFDAKNDVTDMTSFISKNNLSILCMDKNVNKNVSIKGRLDRLINETIGNINVPILVLNTNLN